MQQFAKCWRKFVKNHSIHKINETLVFSSKIWLVNEFLKGRKSRQHYSLFTIHQTVRKLDSRAVEASRREKVDWGLRQLRASAAIVEAPSKERYLGRAPPRALCMRVNYDPRSYIMIDSFSKKCPGPLGYLKRTARPFSFMPKRVLRFGGKRDFHLIKKFVAFFCNFKAFGWSWSIRRISENFHNELEFVQFSSVLNLQNWKFLELGGLGFVNFCGVKCVNVLSFVHFDYLEILLRFLMRFEFYN